MTTCKEPQNIYLNFRKYLSLGLGQPYVIRVINSDGTLNKT